MSLIALPEIGASVVHKGTGRLGTLLSFDIFMGSMRVKWEDGTEESVHPTAVDPLENAEQNP
jgi:hypothetical protein